MDTGLGMTLDLWVSYRRLKCGCMHGVYMCNVVCMDVASGVYAYAWLWQVECMHMHGCGKWSVMSYAWMWQVECMHMHGCGTYKTEYLYTSYMLILYNLLTCCREMTAQVLVTIDCTQTNGDKMCARRERALA